jgi:F-type H+-transporting ATPase subunit gamma
MAQKEVKGRIASVKNIQKITRAMEMVAAARLRKAEQRIEELRPYASAIRRMTRQAADAAQGIPRLPILAPREGEERVGILLFTGDRGLAGAFNSQIVRAGVRAGADYRADGKQVVYYASGRRGVSSLRFRNHEPAGAYEGYTDRPSYANARSIASDLMVAYIDGEVDRVELFYNRYVSPLVQVVTRETLLPLNQASIMEAEDDGTETPAEGDQSGHTALTEYEPGPEQILERLVPSYVEISIFRAMLESTSSEHGARMTAMRNASENAGELIKDLTLQANRERQAAITQEIMEVVSGAESLV